jgi:hypothetical protein
MKTYIEMIRRDIRNAVISAIRGERFYSSRPVTLPAFGSRFK